MGRWFLVRHGETDWNVEGRAQGQMHVPLNDRGLVQAEAIAARLRPMRFTAAYASDLRRVTQTAEAIMRGRDVPLVTLPALRERGFGEWEGLTFTEMEARYPGTVRRAVLRGRLERRAGRRERAATLRAGGRRRGPPAGGARPGRR